MKRTLRLALAQMSMDRDFDRNLEKSLGFMEQAKQAGADLVFFPEIQLSPFFPQFAGGEDPAGWVTVDDPVVRRFQRKAAELEIYCSPNIYFKENNKLYDASLWIEPDGTISGVSKMVHIPHFECFFEQDYYSPSDTGFQVYSTPWGKIGIVICFDRHLPESIRTCVFKGAELILIPTANTLAEDLDLFEWECRVAARQNCVFVAMCNRVGTEGGMSFAGRSLVADPAGRISAVAGEDETILIAECDFEYLKSFRESSSYVKYLRPGCYLSDFETGSGF
jgi:predicted amidohydrolase